MVGARLKDSYMVDSELRQLIEEGYVGPTLRCSHDPYAFQILGCARRDSHHHDGNAGLPCPGVIEVLPALPRSLVKGSINGMLLRTFARLDKLAWDMEARTVDLTVTSLRKQDVALIARHGIEAIAAPTGVLAASLRPGSAACEVHLPEGKPVEFHLKLGQRDPLDWASRVV